MKKLFLILVIIQCAVAIMFSQSYAKKTSDKDRRLKDDKPTVYLGYVCGDKDVYRFRFNNNTNWAITVNTFSFYYKTKKLVELQNGWKVYTMPNDKEIPSLHFYVEKDNNSSTEGKLPNVGYPDSYAHSWIASGDSILFSIPADFLTEGLQIYVPFNYEWELNKKSTISNEPQHKVYFRGVSFANIDPLVACN